MIHWLGSTAFEELVALVLKPLLDGGQANKTCPGDEEELANIAAPGNDGLAPRDELIVVDCELIRFEPAQEHVQTCFVDRCIIGVEERVLASFAPAELEDLPARASNPRAQAQFIVLVDEVVIREVRDTGEELAYRAEAADDLPATLGP